MTLGKWVKKARESSEALEKPLNVSEREELERLRGRMRNYTWMLLSQKKNSDLVREGKAVKFAAIANWADQELLVPLPEFAGLALAEHLRHFPAVDGLIFTSRERQPMNRNYINAHVWKPALRLAGVEPTRHNGMHALRHYFASVLNRRGGVGEGRCGVPRARRSRFHVAGVRAPVPGFRGPGQARCGRGARCSRGLAAD